MVQGVERTRSVLVDGSAIGTDPLFRAAGILTRPLPGEHLVRKRQREQQDQVRSCMCYLCRLLYSITVLSSVPCAAAAA